MPLAILLGLAAPPLGLIAWMALSGSRRRDFLRSNWVRSGFAIGLGATLPLLAVGGAALLGLGSDPNPNPIGLGLLSLVGGILATALMTIGVVLVSRRGG
jgi:hypothetical protein